jgi:heme exporter protein A
LAHNAIHLERLTKTFGHIRALAGIDLIIKKGEFFTLFGPNGAGKTTLVRILSTLARPSGGKAVVNGIDTHDNAEPIRSHIGVISHHTYLYNNLSAHENLRFYGRLYDVENLEKRIGEVIGRVGLYGREHDLVRTYSRGMQQRLSIARAILHSPSILFLDEPYTGLDQHAAQMLNDLLAEHKGERTIFLITHNLARGLTLCDRVAIQVKGSIIYEKQIKHVNRENFEALYFKHVGETGASGGNRLGW